MDVLFRRARAASSAGSVSFSFIHTNDMPLSFAGFLAGFFAAFGRFPVSPLPPNALRGGRNSSVR
jgi:hypothetical protein